MKEVFTTGEAAKICKVSQQTIIRCFDNGQLKGFRVPGSKFRRIPREVLYRFMRDNGIPTGGLSEGRRKVLLLEDDPDNVALIDGALREDGRFEVKIAARGFDAGMLIREYHPDLIVLDVMLPGLGAKEVCECVRADSNLAELRIICLTAEENEEQIASLKLSGVDECIHHPFDVETLIEKICEQLGMDAPLPRIAVAS